VARFPAQASAAGGGRLPEARAALRRDHVRVGEPLRPGFAADLARRVGTAAIALPLLVLVLFKAPPLATVALVAVACAIGLIELFAMLAAGGIVAFPILGQVCAFLLFLSISIPVAATLPPRLPAVTVAIAAAALLRAKALPTSVPAAAGTLFAAAYVGVLGGTIAALRTLEPAADGAWRVTLLLAIVMSSDTFAYFTGSAFGRHKLAPLVSPGKTIEGLAGGLAGGVVAALLVRQFGLPHIPAAAAVALGIIVSAFGVAGDLVESLIKRWSGVKDSGHLFPGHGGMLDRLDSLLFGAPVLYYYFLYAR
jgi:phosphatidate cytidylyltransferase